MSWIKRNDGGNITPVDPLSNLTAGLLGSSSMDTKHRRKGFIEWVSERTGLKLLDYAIGGSSTTTTIEDWENNPATLTSGLQMTKRLIDEKPELDLIVCQPLINDEYRPLGDWESTSPMECYGAMHILVKMVLETYPEKPFGLITGQYIPGMNKKRESLRHECIKEIGHYYGIPVLDLRGEGLTPYVLDSFVENYVPDGTHLSDEGAKIASRRVEAFIRMLVTGYEE